ncbi:MAG: hypothetical protein O3C23_00230 [bacterium]|nr:hypothetical protein [bacterium]
MNPRLMVVLAVIIFAMMVITAFSINSSGTPTVEGQAQRGKQIDPEELRTALADLGLVVNPNGTLQADALIANTVNAGILNADTVNADILNGVERTTLEQLKIDLASIGLVVNPDGVLTLEGLVAGWIDTGVIQ